MSCAALNQWLQNSRVGMRLLRIGLSVLLLQFTLGNALHAQSMSHGMSKSMSAMTQEASHVSHHHCEDMESMGNDTNMPTSMSMNTSPMQHASDSAAIPHSPDCCKSSQCQCVCMIMPMVSMQLQVDVIDHEFVPSTILIIGPHSRSLITPFRPPIH